MGGGLLLQLGDWNGLPNLLPAVQYKAPSIFPSLAAWANLAVLTTTPSIHLPNRHAMNCDGTIPGGKIVLVPGWYYYSRVLLSVSTISATAIISILAQLH